MGPVPLGMDRMEEDVLKIFVTTMAALAAVSAFAQFSENWDGYATGTQMHGTNGWVGWDNSPAAGALTSNAFASSAPNAIDVNGATDLVHMFSVSGGQWVWKMKQYVPNAFTGQTYFILNNIYNHSGPYNWSVQMFMNGAANQVGSDLTATPPTPLTLVRDAWVPIRCEIDLTGDTVSEYYNGALLWTHDWTPATGGTATIGAVDLYANGASSVYYDDILLLPNPYPVNASAYSVFQGLNFGGNLASLSASDNNKVVVLCDELDSNSGVEFSGTSLDTNPVEIKLIVEESSSRSDISLFTSIRRVSTSSWQQVHFATSTLADQTYTTTISASTANYFTAAGIIRAQVVGIPQADIDSGDGWTVSIDQGRFELKP